MISPNLTLDERFEWLKNNKPKEIKADMYMYCFNHPYYVGEPRLSDDEERHLLLDELNIPRML